MVNASHLRPLPLCAALSALLLSACTGEARPDSASRDMAGGMSDVAQWDVPDVPPGDISIEVMKEVTRTLSSDEFEGRMPGTPGEDKTVTYLVQQFAEAGLQPGNNGSWFQEVPLVEITASQFSPLTIGGAAEPIELAHRTDWVGVTYREVPQVTLENSELVFVGYGINAPEKGWNDYEGLDMRGKTAVILVNDPDWLTDSLEGPFGGAAMTYYGRWTYKFEEAARQGAAGALIVHDTFPASYGWNVVEEGWTGPQAYAERGNGGADQTLMNGWIQLEVARALFEATGRNFDELAVAASQSGFAPIPLGLIASARFENSIRRYNSRNVIGVLPGSEAPDEYILHSAHWDHLGRCGMNAEGDDICNGAIDNATGTAALVALAKAHKKAGPASRSLVFLAVTAEEQGLLGSEYYGANPVFPLEQTVGGVNMDALSLAGPAHDVTVIGGGKSELDAFLAKALKAGGRTASPDPAPSAGRYYRSDHFSFAKRGVPMLYVDGGEDLLDGGKSAGGLWMTQYTLNAYHGPEDEYDPAWDWTGVEQDLQLYFRLGRMMAQSHAWPNWMPGDEFRRIRDESCTAPGGC